MTTTNPPAVNVDLLRQVRRRILTNPTGWDQGSWGTCTAGHTVRQAGGVFCDAFGRTGRPGEPLPRDIYRCRMPGAEHTEPIEAAATRLLGLDEAGCDLLFTDDYNNIGELVVRIGTLTGDTRPHPFTADTVGFPVPGSGMACTECGGPADYTCHTNAPNPPATGAPPRGEYCTRHLSWHCQAGYGLCQVTFDTPTGQPGS